VLELQDVKTECINDAQTKIRNSLYVGDKIAGSEKATEERRSSAQKYATGTGHTSQHSETRAEGLQALADLTTEGITFSFNFFIKVTREIYTFLQVIIVAHGNPFVT